MQTILKTDGFFEKSMVENGGVCDARPRASIQKRFLFLNFTVSKQHTSGFMFQKHFSRTDQKTAPVHVLPRDALREHINRHISKILFQFHAKS